MLTALKKIWHALSAGERKIFLGAVALLGLSAIISGVMALRANTVQAPAYGGNYTEGLVGQPSAINPITAMSEADQALVHLVFSSLGELAESVEPLENAKSWKVRLKENLTWHDGTKLTSDDVVFTVRNIQDPDSRSLLYTRWQGVLMQRVSEREIQFNLGTADNNFNQDIKGLYIAPKHIFQDIPLANWRISEFTLKPIGSGPYKIYDYAVQANGFINSYTLKAYTQRATGDRPYINQIVFKFFATTEDAIKAFNTGRIDALGGLELGDIGLLHRSYTTFNFQLPNYYAVFFNQSQNLVLKDEAVRRALNLAVDPKELAKTIAGAATPAYGPVPTFSQYFDPKLQRESNLDQAAALLEEAGWHTTDAGGREKDVNGSKLSLKATLTVPQISFLKKTATELQSRWAKIGATINIEEIPVDELLGNTIKNRNYQMLLFGNTLNTAYDLFPFWHSAERFYPGLNLSIYSNKDVDRILEILRHTDDDAARLANMDKLQGLILEDMPAIFLYSPAYTYIVGKDLYGLQTEVISNPSDRFTEISKWHLETKRVFK